MKICKYFLFLLIITPFHNIFAIECIISLTIQRKNSDQKALEREMISYWLSFAKSHKVKYFTQRFNSPLLKKKAQLNDKELKLMQAFWLDLYETKEKLTYIATKITDELTHYTYNQLNIDVNFMLNSLDSFKPDMTVKTSKLVLENKIDKELAFEWLENNPQEKLFSALFADIKRFIEQEKNLSGDDRKHRREHYLAIYYKTLRALHMIDVLNIYSNNSSTTWQTKNKLKSYLNTFRDLEKIYNIEQFHFD